MFGIRVNRLDPDQVADLIITSIYVACFLKTNPRYTLEQFVNEANAEDIERFVDTAGYQWGLATLPFLEMAVKGMPSFQMLTEKPNDA